MMTLHEDLHALQLLNVYQRENVLNKHSGEKWNTVCVQYIFHISFTVFMIIEQKECNEYHYELSYSAVKRGFQNTTVIKKKVLTTLDCIKIR